MLRALLDFAMVEATAVGTAAQALSLMQAERFDLFLLDARLPDIDGFELCRRMRLLDPHTPILFFSGAAYETDKKRGIEAGANAYVVKPDIAGLVGSVKQLIAGTAPSWSGEVHPLAWRDIERDSPSLHITPA